MPASDPSGSSPSTADRPTLTPRMAALMAKGPSATTDDYAQLTTEDHLSLASALQALPVRELGRLMHAHLDDRQCAAELRDVEDGRTIYEANTRKAIEKGYQSQTAVGQHLLRQLLKPAAAALRADIDAARTGKVGWNMRRLNRYLGDEDEYVVMRIVLEVAIDSFSRPQDTSQAVIERVGERLEDWQREKALYQQLPNLHRHIDEDTQGLGEGAKRHRHRRLVNAMNKVDIPWTPWPDQDRRVLGQHILHYLQQHVGLIELETRRYGRKLYTHVQPTREAIDWLNKHHEALASLAAVKRPMVTPPAHWEPGQIKGGGYLFKLSHRDRIVRGPHKGQVDRLKVANMPEVYRALNVLQWTGWKINQAVLEVMRQVWDSGSPLGGLPVMVDDDDPIRPHDIDTNEEARREYRRAKHEAIERRLKMKAKRLHLMKTLDEAQRFSHEHIIWYPHNCDFRGRTYPIPSVLSPQGCDYERGLLLFWKTKPLGTPEAAEWLAIHGANCYGQDKIPRAQQVAWVEEHEREILASANDPFECRFWSHADEPWQFLAFCYEWAGYKRDGLDHESALPVAMDGTCNGIQHLAAMLRDEKIGAAVNLIPSDTPQDVYRDVAECLRAELNRRRNAGDILAARWFTYDGLNRSLTKGPVMTLAYGLTKSGYLDALFEHLDDEAMEGRYDPFRRDDDDTRTAAVMYLRDAVWKAIEDTLPQAMKVRNLLQSWTRVMTELGKPVTWQAPTGFPIVQYERAMEDKRLKTLLRQKDGKPYTPKFEVLAKDERIDAAAQTRAVGPNFIHSLDAAAMHLTVGAMADQVWPVWLSMIHDSYATHAADAPLLASTLRRVFRRFYEDHDVLAELRASMIADGADPDALKPVPERGTLDIAQVEDSLYFFH